MNSHLQSRIEIKNEEFLQVGNTLIGEQKYGDAKLVLEFANKKDPRITAKINECDSV
jgi:hypothetical protein